MEKLLHTTRISIPEKERIELIAILNSTLASTTDLYIQLKQAHWNIKGMEFIGVHELLDGIAEEIEEQVDIVAERVTTLGGTALGTLQQAVTHTQLPAYPINIFSVKDHLTRLAHHIAMLGEFSRNNIKAAEKLGDMATGDIYIDLTRLLDKRLWFLEAHLQK
jgi:starvation-inducible DNA-binding protein